VHHEVATEAVVLRTRPYGESDRIVTLLTEQHGKVTGIAKGAKNSRRRFGGTLEPFLRIRAVFQQRSTSDLVFLLRCEFLSAWRVFGRDLDRYAAGSTVLELTDRMVHGRESGREVFRLTEEALDLLDAGAACDPVLRAFELHLLAVTGYAPALDHCRECGRTPEAPTLYLAAERGGFLCRACVRPYERVRPVAATTVREIARLAAGPLAAAAASASATTLAEAAVVAELLIGNVSSGPLRTRAFTDAVRRRIDSVPRVR
jgi:DNA repair protein RecO (recombination protein O)